MIPQTEQTTQSPKTRAEYMALAEQALKRARSVSMKFDEDEDDADRAISLIQCFLAEANSYTELAKLVEPAPPAGRTHLFMSEAFRLALDILRRHIPHLGSVSECACDACDIERRLVAGIKQGESERMPPAGRTSCAIFADTEQEHENLLSTADAALQWFDENAHLDIPTQMVDDLRAAVGGHAKVKPRPDVNADLLTSLQCATRVLRFVRDGDNISREAIASHVEVFEGIITIAEQGGSTP